MKGVVWSAAAMGVLLEEGIGDTIRVSLTPEPGGDRCDVNADGKITRGDLSAVFSARGSAPGGRRWNPRADVDLSGFIDGDDEVVRIVVAQREAQAVHDPGPGDGRLTEAGVNLFQATHVN